MYRRMFVKALLLLLPLLPAAAVSLHAQPSAAGSRIFLRTRTFDPLATQAVAAAANARGNLYLLQFAGPVREEWKDAVVRAGARLYGYIPEHAFIARMDAATASAVRALPQVRWVGPYLPADRVEPELAEVLEASDTLTVTVQTLPDADLGALAGKARALGGTVAGQARNAAAGYLQTTLPAAKISELAAADGVLWIEPFVAPVLFNNTGGGGIMRVNDVRQQLGLFGAGQIVGVADSGLDTGNPATLHPDVRGRVIQAQCFGRPNPCDWSDADGHGTHVVGSVLGNGAVSGSNPGAHQYANSYAGNAPEAQLVFQGIGDNQGGLGGIPTDRGELMRQAYNAGARIHTNSWGGPTGGTGQAPQYGGYVESSQQIDQIAWERKDLLILFAAGNSGTDANDDGVIDADSLGQPGTAKNALTVGASENMRPGITSTWGTRYSPPIADDKRADQPNGMAAFSSRGPTDDGRIKPDIVAPGVFVASLLTGGAFRDNLEGDTSRYGAARLGGGTTDWTLTGDAHSPSRAWNQTVNGTFNAGALTAVLTPPMNVLAIGGEFDISWWHKWSLGSNDEMVVLFIAPTLDDPSVIDFGSLTLDNTGSNTTYAKQSVTLSADELIDAGLDPRVVQIGFAVRSDDGAYNSTWSVDDLRVGGHGTMADLGLAQPNDAIDGAYTAISGTSMATPLTAGAATLVREWLTRLKGVAQPSAALIKALLMNGAADMGPGQYGTGATREIPATRPNYVSGWGRVDVMESLAPAAPRQVWFADDNTGLATGGTRQYTLQVGAGAAGMVAPAAATELLQNPGFESGSLAPWETHGDTLYSNPRIDTTGPHGGNASALMGGAVGDLTDTISQQVSVPAGATGATLDFWYRLSSAETTDNDGWCYGLLENDLSFIAGGCASFRGAGNTGWTRKTWTLPAADLAKVKGRAIRVAFYATNSNRQAPSRLWVDDTSFTITTADAPPAPVPPAPPAPGAGSPLRVTLNWTDFPGQPGAARALVNDLDLEVVAPDGTRYLGNQNVYPAGHPCIQNGVDVCNPVEGVTVPQATPGAYTVIVRAREVPQGGGQPFALAGVGDGLRQVGGAPVNQVYRVHVPLTTR